ncbi:MAG: trypsin-like peptidase domain-containing protein [Nitrospinae bacterium]|nr:trypsin-like peptidase domain-containing protein [Nitrospinota bacterium]MBF0633201.1 trypsin-like peptidase domain-containing protein [Nitrospinota bacterium]
MFELKKEACLEALNKALALAILLATVCIPLTSGKAFAQKNKVAQRAVTPRGDLLPEEKEAIKVFQKCSPSVVYITTLTLSQNIFSRNVFEIPKGTGSGFIWDTNGHIVTNFHVVENSNKIEVTLHGGAKMNADIVGVAPDKDIAVLKISALLTTLKLIDIGDANSLLVGQKVYAIGNPFGLDSTMTSGIVSALGREIVSMTGRPIQGAIQTDAAINPGNSGGPLLDSAGRLIGINTAIYSPSGASSGIGFALPVEIVNRVVTELIVNGRIIRPGIGVSIAADDINARLGIEGVLITRVFPETPAHSAKLRETIQRGSELILGDIIVSVDGKAIHKANDLYNIFDNARVGDVVKLGILRGKKTLFIQLRLEDIH